MHVDVCEIYSRVYQFCRENVSRTESLHNCLLQRILRLNLISGWHVGGAPLQFIWKQIKLASRLSAPHLIASRYHSRGLHRSLEKKKTVILKSWPSPHRENVRNKVKVQTRSSYISLSLIRNLRTSRYHSCLFLTKIICNQSPAGRFLQRNAISKIISY